MGTGVKSVEVNQPGKETEMGQFTPQYDDPNYKGSGKLKDKVALITGGDSGIGRATSIAFAKEGAHVAIVYYNEDEDAHATQALVQEKGSKCLLIKGDVSQEKFCQAAIEKTMEFFGQLDILVNNAAMHTEQEKLEDISSRQMISTFAVNVFSMIYLTQAALKYLKPGSTIVNTASVTAYRGSSHLLDYASTKGAIVSFTRSLAASLADQNIRVNGVAPGPIMTPLITSSFPKEEVESFGKDVPLGRPGQPCEVAPSFVFLASTDSSYMTGQFLHPNGGSVINT